MCDVFRHGAKLAPNGNCLGSYNKQTGQYSWQTYQKVLERIENCATGLAHLVKQHQLMSSNEKLFIGLWSQNRPEFQIIQQTCFHLSFIVVPLYDTLGSEAIRFIIQQSTRLKV